MQLLSPIKKNFIFCFLFILISVTLYGSQIIIKQKIEWLQLSNYKIDNVLYPYFITFKNAHFNSKRYKSLPIFQYNTYIKSARGIQVLLKNEIYQPIDNSISFQNKEYLKSISNSEIIYQTGTERGKEKIVIQILPIRFNSISGSFEKIVSFELVINTDDPISSSIQSAKRIIASNSVLSSGDWYKIAVVNNGIHKLDASFFSNNKINIGGIDPRTIKIYGNGAGMLPQLNSSFRYDDLHEDAIIVNGESDARFDPGDFILFYGQGQNAQWTYDSTSKRYSHITNIYSDTTYYFITFGGAFGKRISNQSSGLVSTNQTDQFDCNYVYENDATNLMKSGRFWVGEDFDRITQRDFPVNMGAMNVNESVYLKSSVVARSFVPSNFNVSIIDKFNSYYAITHSIGAVVPNFEDTYAFTDYPQTALLKVNDPALTVHYVYNQPISGSVGWLDYFELQSRNYLQFASHQFNFRDSRTVGAGNITQFNFTNLNNGIRIWDVSNPLDPAEMLVSQNGSNAQIISATNTLKEFIAFDGLSFFIPQLVGKVLNQNLHNIPPTDYVIVTHPQFINEAKQLAGIYSSKMKVQVVQIDQIFNEFSSGAEDICAVRDFMRMLYKRDSAIHSQPKYLMLFGRASFDYKYRVANNTNYIPTFESVESFDPTNTYNSDDFYGFLDDNEGRWDSPLDNSLNIDLLDVGIGRFPAQNNFQAQTMVNKVIKYKSNSAFGDWRNKMVFVCDDGDQGGDSFVAQSELMANSSDWISKNYNIEKIYGDAYKVVEEAGGARNPDAENAIVRSIERGALIVDYTGHGGQVGWSAERTLNTDDINGFTNQYNLPLFVTATCVFSPFDDPTLTSAGELVLSNPNGGGIALFTTVRLTLGGANNTLNNTFFNYAGFDSASVYKRLNLGDIIMLTKNDVSNDKNERNFVLLGDPALMLDYPEYKVSTTKINTKIISSVADTMKAFANVTVEGIVTDLNGTKLTNFSGTLLPSVFDKPQTYSTLPNNSPGCSAIPFLMQNNVIYRGRVSVNNGAFKFSFIVPKDITYQNGYGKISYYASSDTVDANGNYTNFIVGGTADSIGIDHIGPQIALYMNDFKFVNGGVTNESPLFIAKLSDESGINIVGTGIGRDLQLTINSTSFSVNDYYKAKLDTYKEGDVNYQFKNLPQGSNKVKLRAWDVYNNYSEGSLDFIVASSANVALQHVLNYPNPFTTFTTFHFDHNKAGENLTVQIQIFTISGKLIKTLKTDAITANGHFDQLSWDGKDDYGDAIGKGVYIYKVIVKSQDNTAEQFQKLVLLN